jgi:hypothetical protein
LFEAGTHSLSTGVAQRRVSAKASQSTMKRGLDSQSAASARQKKDANKLEIKEMEGKGENTYLSNAFRKSKKLWASFMSESFQTF